MVGTVLGVAHDGVVAQDVASGDASDEFAHHLAAAFGTTFRGDLGVGKHRAGRGAHEVFRQARHILELQVVPNDADGFFLTHAAAAQVCENVAHESLPPCRAILLDAF